MSATKSKTSYSPLGDIQPKFNRLFLVICLLFAFGIFTATWRLNFGGLKNLYK